MGERNVLEKRFAFAGEPGIIIQLKTGKAFDDVRTAVQQAGYHTFDLT